MADSNQDKTGIKTTQDIIDLRQRLGMSREEFGALAGVKADAVGKWERGVTFPTKAKVKALEAWLNTSYNRDAQQAFAQECEERDTVSPDGQASLLERMPEDSEPNVSLGFDVQAPDITPDLEDLIEPPSEYFKMRTALYMGQRDEAEAELDDLLTDEERAAIEEICTPRTTGIGEQLLSLHGLFGLGVSAHRVSQALGDNVAKGYRTNDYPCVYWPNHRAVLANAIRSLIRVNLTDNPRRPTALLALAKRIEQGRVASPERYKAMLYNDPIVRKIVTMTDDGNGYFSPHLASFEALGFCAREIPQAINHIQAPPNGVWRWPEHKSNLIALAQELKGQLYMHAVGCSPWGDRVKIDLNIARMDAVITRLKLNDILFDSDTPQESPEDMTNIIPQAATNPQNVTIDWNALVGDHQGIKGVSLRHLLTLGLYSSYQKAKEALERVAEDFLTESLKSITLTTGGRPAEDLIITDLKVVKIFCMCAGTPVGQQIRDTIIAHHDELQAMLAGDAAAQARHEQAKAPQAAVSADPLDALATMIEQMRAQRDALAAQQQRQQALEENINAVGQRTAQLVQRLNSTPLAGERSAYQVAEEAGVKSGSGRPHSNSIVALMHEMGLPQEGHAWQVTTEINGKLADSWRFNATGAAMLKRELARLAQRGTVLEDGRIRFEVRGKTCTYTVYR